MEGDFKGTAYLLLSKMYLKEILTRDYTAILLGNLFIRSKISFTNKDPLMSEVRSLLEPKKI